MIVKTIYAEITNQCNLNCRTCYNCSGLNRERRELSKADLVKIIQLFAPLGLERFLLSGGEPTLHTEFESILDLVEEYPQLSFGIVTNGTVFNEKLIHMLNTRSNLTLQISLDGSDEEHNAKTRGSGRFSDTINFAKQIHNSYTKPRLKMVISQSNLDDVEAFYHLALSVNFLPEFAFVYKSGNGTEEWGNKILSASEKFKVLKLVDRLNQETGANAFLPLCTDSCPLADEAQPISPCVKADGSIQPCQLLYGNKYSIGNIFRNFYIGGFINKFAEISDIAKKRLNVDYGCKYCLLRDNCEKGCMASAVTLHDNPLSNDGDCEFRKLQFLGHNLKRIMNTSIPHKDENI